MTDNKKFSKFIENVGSDMIKVLQNCSKNNKDCSCIIGVKYLKDLPPDKNKKLVLYCGDNSNRFVDHSTILVNEFLQPNFINLSTTI